MQQEFAPIVLFVYCRPNHTKQTVDALLLNKEAADSDLIIYSDAPKNEGAKDGVEQTRRYIHSITGFKNISIIERDRNWGLAKNLIDGISTVVNKYGKVIVIEDDIKVSPYCLKYFNDGLELFKNEKKMASLHAYTIPHDDIGEDTFLMRGADCWGWATWKRAWDLYTDNPIDLKKQLIERNLVKEFELDYTFPYMDMLQARIEGKISSWAISWYASTFLNDMYTMYPNISMASQIGMDGIGATHSGVSDRYIVRIADTALALSDKIKYVTSQKGYKAFKKFHLNGLDTPRRKFSYYYRIIKRVVFKKY